MIPAKMAHRCAIVLNLLAGASAASLSSRFRAEQANEMHIQMNRRRLSACDDRSVARVTFLRMRLAPIFESLRNRTRPLFILIFSTNSSYVSCISDVSYNGCANCLLELSSPDANFDDDDVTGTTLG